MNLNLKLATQDKYIQKCLEKLKVEKGHKDPNDNCSINELINLILFIKKYFKLECFQINFVPSYLKYTNNFHLLCAIILSAQTLDKTVNTHTFHILKKYNSPQKILLIQDLEQQFNKINFYKNKTKTIQTTAQYLIDNQINLERNVFELNKFNQIDNLITCKGIGVKTLNIFKNIVLNENIVAVDTHVSKIISILFKKQKVLHPKILHQILNKYAFPYFTRHMMITIGKNVCNACKRLLLYQTAMPKKNNS